MEGRKFQKGLFHRKYLRWSVVWVCFFFLKKFVSGCGLFCFVLVVFVLWFFFFVIGFLCLPFFNCVCVFFVLELLP